MKKKKILSLIMLIALASNVVMSNSIAYANNLVSTSSQLEIKNEDKSIISSPTASVEQMQKWARSKGATETFISLAPKYMKLYSSHGGINPIVAYAQSALETGYGNFGGVIDESYNNPCGMKTKEAGGNTDSDPNAHQKFDSWEDGISAHLDHLALYAGANGYPRVETKDPRHFSFIFGRAKSVLGLSGAWASDKQYGEKVLKMTKEIENIEKGENPTTPVEPKPPTTQPEKPVIPPNNSGNTGNPPSNSGNTAKPPSNSGITEKTGKVTASALNVRSGAGTSYKVIGSLKNGSTVTVVETKNGWHKIKYGSSYGYVSSSYIKINSTISNGSTNNSGNTAKPPSNSGSTQKTGKVTASALNVRSGAGTSYKVIGSLKNGSTVTVVETKNGWYKIKYGSSYGYVSSSYIKINSTSSNGSANNSGNTVRPPSNSGSTQKTGKVTASILNVRSGAGTSHKVIGSLRNGSTVTIVETKNGWHKIKYGSSYGYVSSSYIKINSTSSNGSANNSENIQKTGKVTADVLNVRSGRGTNYSKIGAVRGGSTVTIVETKNGWHKIKYGNGYGYVSAQYVR
ncbi:SH3 domain-containing protein [Clostridium thermobutyricum]|uniref:Bacteriocin BCN5 n=1 Tax=Clostridium thermobutyricum DSM 4928 TaxID=1121339 RepID=A0A1V4SU74_9CLOT|nr:SH3 domain-containing protein [Clostridium thermobutyricum]OPX47419.1 bacteriocin BCN5 [Clostridium thermobutyricum DSM 4928]